jgi:hypothetical protein
MLKHRINEALEDLLSDLYNERGIESGDISPLMLLEWDDLTEKLDDLFQRLIDLNTTKED